MQTSSLEPQHLKGGEYVALMRPLSALADQVNGPAQTNVGLMSHNRHGVPQR
jgi:hypothetical protein